MFIKVLQILNVKRASLLILFILILHLNNPDVLSAGTSVKVGLYQNAPMVFTDRKGEVKGIYIDVLKYVASKKSWSIKYIHGTWGQCLERFETGQLDVLIGIAYSEERALKYDFTNETVLSNWGQIYSRKNFKFESILKLDSKKIAVLKKNIFYTPFRDVTNRFNIPITFVEVENFKDIFRLLSKGKVAAGLTNRLYGFKHEAEYRNIIRTPIVRCPVELRFAFPKNNSKCINKTLDRYLIAIKANKNSIYFQSLNRWFGGIEKYTYPWWLKWVLGIIGSIVLLVLLLIVIFRKQIREKIEGLLTEISRRKQGEESLRKSEKEYRFLADKVEDIIWILRLSDMHFVYSNLAVERILGYTPEELNKLKLSLIITPKSLNNIKKAISEEINREGREGVLPDRSRIIELELICRDGSMIYAEIVASFLRNKKGKPVSILGITRDITLRKKMEIELRKSETGLRESQQLLKNILDTIPVRVFWKDLNLRYLGCNRPFAYDAGMENPEDLVGKDDYEMGWVEQAGLYRADDEYVIKTGIGKFNYEEPQTASDGRQKWLETSKIPLKNTEGKIIGLLGVYRDITERKLAEIEHERLLHAINQVDEAVVITDPGGIIQYVNPAFENITGYSSKEVVGQNPSILKSGKQDKSFYEELWSTLIRGDTWDGQFINKKKSGELYTEEAVISPVQDSAGITTNYVAVKRDITDRIKLQQQLLQSQKMESVGRLAGGIAHDLNNMLSVIIGYVQLSMDKVKPSDPLYSYLREIFKAAEHSANISKQLLTFARKEIVTPRVLNLNGIIKNMLKMLQSLIGENIKVVWCPGMSLWSIKMDSGQIDQILANLCVNARDAIKNVGTITIETKNASFDEAYCHDHPGFIPGDYVMLAVSDDGCGMDKETISNIFEPFFTTKGIGKGTGLGLSTIYGIVTQNNGFIKVYSEPDKGSSFKTYIPKISENIIEEHEVDSKKLTKKGSETILLVDDEPTILEMTKMILEHQGYTVITASTPGDALTMAKSYTGKISLLITDVIMPEMNGKKLATKLLSIYPALKLLFMSGYTSDVIISQGVSDMDVHFIRKPFNTQALGVAVRKVLED